MSEEEPQKETPPPAGDMIARATAAAERLERANERAATLNAEAADIAARNVLGGQSDAGQAPEKPKEETPQEYAARVMKGDVDAGE